MATATLARTASRLDPQWDGPTVGTLDALANIATECEEASRTERDIRRLEALAEIATWCQQQAEPIAEGDERPWDVATVAWEIGYRLRRGLGGAILGDLASSSRHRADFGLISDS